MNKLSSDLEKVAVRPNFAKQKSQGDSSYNTDDIEALKQQVGKYLARILGSASHNSNIFSASTNISTLWYVTQNKITLNSDIRGEEGYKGTKTQSSPLMPHAFNYLGFYTFG